MARRRRRFGLRVLLSWFAVIPKTKSGWQFFFRRFKLWRQMMRQVFRGKSKTPWATIIAIIAIVIYVAMPFDLIPDFFLFFGWLDDAFIVLKLLSLINIDLRRYIKQHHIDPEPFNLQE